LRLALTAEIELTQINHVAVAGFAVVPHFVSAKCHQGMAHENEKKPGNQSPGRFHPSNAGKSLTTLQIRLPPRLEADTTYGETAVNGDLLPRDETRII
jgi:hypothetical protein